VSGDHYDYAAGELAALGLRTERREESEVVNAVNAVDDFPQNGFRSSWTAKDLMGHVFPEPRYAVPGVLAEGANLLAGAPKLGKSWLALNVSAAVAYGGLALDKVHVERGEALYLALEDPPRRLQRRLRLILGGATAPDGLFIETEWERLLEGGCDRLDAWLGAHPDCRLVTVDVFAKVRGVVAGNVNRYEADYAAMSSLKSVADAHGVAALVVHHTRKAAADDFVDSVSGTHGLAAAADAVLVLSRSRGSADAKLHVTGRDIEEAEYAMQFDPANGTWALLEGPAEEYELGTTRRRILAHVREHGPATPKAIADGLQIEYETVKKTCQRMAVDEQLGTDGSGVYSYLSPVSLVSPAEESPAKRAEHAPIGAGQQGQQGQGTEEDIDQNEVERVQDLFRQMQEEQA
jgi:hypothetical protein